MGAIGDPRADVGYLLATYSEPGGPPNPLGTSPVTALAGFPSRRDLVERYSARSGRDIEPLAWFEALALWKAAVFCEAIYGRFLRGELGPEDTRAARFEQGVPYLAESAAAALTRDDGRSERSDREAVGSRSLRLERELGEGSQRLGLLRRDEQRRGSGLPPGVEALGEALLRPDERDLVDERIGHRGRGVALVPVEVEILDLARGVLVAVPAGEVVVEVLAARAHAADVERVVRLQELAAGSTSSMRITGAVAAMSKPSRAPTTTSPNALRALSGDQKIGSQPSAISNACATAFGPMTAR